MRLERQERAMNPQDNIGFWNGDGVLQIPPSNEGVLALPKSTTITIPNIPNRQEDGKNNNNSKETDKKGPAHTSSDVGMTTHQYYYSPTVPNQTHTNLFSITQSGLPFPIGLLWSRSVDTTTEYSYSSIKQSGKFLAPLFAGIVLISVVVVLLLYFLP